MQQNNMACVQDKLSSSATAAGQGPSWPWLCSFCPFTFVLRHLWSQGENEKVGVRRGDNIYEVRRGEKFAKDWPDSWTKYLWLDHLCLLTGLFSSMFQKNGFQALQKSHRLCRKLSTSQRQEDLRVSLFSKGPSQAWVGTSTTYFDSPWAFPEETTRGEGTVELEVPGVPKPSHSWPSFLVLEWMVSELAGPESISRHCKHP